MAQVWSRSRRKKWRYRHLEANAFTFNATANMAQATASSCIGNEELPIRGEGPEQELAGTPLCGRTSCMARACNDVDGTPAWVVLCGADAQVRLNGTPLLLGLAMLRDRDEIVLPSVGVDGRAAERRFYFSTEELAKVVAAPAGLTQQCPRCKLSIAPGDLAVRCPSCGAWHHQSESDPCFPCWSYTDRCAACHQHETSLDGQLHWTPAEL